VSDSALTLGAGLILIVVGLLGGGFQAKEISFPHLSTTTRVLSLGGGVALIVFAMYLRQPIVNGSPAPASTPSSTVIAIPPATPTPTPASALVPIFTLTPSPRPKRTLPVPILPEDPGRASGS
jgi:hypothetical protein